MAASSRTLRCRMVKALRPLCPSLSEDASPTGGQARISRGGRRKSGREGRVCDPKIRLLDALAAWSLPQQGERAISGWAGEIVRGHFPLLWECVRTCPPLLRRLQRHPRCPKRTGNMSMTECPDTSICPPQARAGGLTRQVLDAMAQTIPRTRCCRGLDSKGLSVGNEVSGFARRVWVGGRLLPHARVVRTRGTGTAASPSSARRTGTRRLAGGVCR